MTVCVTLEVPAALCLDCDPLSELHMLLSVPRTNIECGEGPTLLVIVVDGLALFLVPGLAVFPSHATMSVSAMVRVAAVAPWPGLAVLGWLRTALTVQAPFRPLQIEIHTLAACRSSSLALRRANRDKIFPNCLQAHESEVQPDTFGWVRIPSHTLPAGYHLASHLVGADNAEALVTRERAGLLVIPCAASARYATT